MKKTILEAGELVSKSVAIRFDSTELHLQECDTGLTSTLDELVGGLNSTMDTAVNTLEQGAQGLATMLNPSPYND